MRAKEIPVSGGNSLPNSPQPEPVKNAVSGLLRAWGKGNLQAREELMPLVYAQLRRQAAACLRSERPDHTLQPTALVNEAYLKLIGQERVVWQNRAHFYGVAAQMMRRILVDHARRHRRGKRFGTAIKVVLDERLVSADPPDCDVLLLDQALHELAAIDPQQAQIVELRYFGGMTEGEVASVLTISRSTVTREWLVAKGWLYRRMTSGQDRGLP